MVSEKSIVNALVALLATGGSTNHTLHWVAIARAAGICVDWDDYAELSRATPLLTRIYPNGDADVNHFHQAGGTPLLIRELLDAGLLHEDVETVMGSGLRAYTKTPVLDNGELKWQAAPAASLDAGVLRPVSEPFSAEGGLTVVQGNLGRGIIKTSAVATEHHFVEAPARVFDDQSRLADAFEQGELNHDFVAVVRWQGPAANGMPELHKLTPYLGSLQDRGYRVALVTDGRMSGASGKVPAAIHVYPEAARGGPLSKVRDGDMIRLDASQGELSIILSDEELAAREPARPDLSDNQWGLGRELFSWFRQGASEAEKGATLFFQGNGD
jgi:phosphogluconate dehydratase